MVFSRCAGAGPLEWLLPAPRRAVLILERCVACDTSFASCNLLCWAAHRPERSRNVLQLAALLSLQVDCITSNSTCQGIFSASTAFVLFRGVWLASAVVLLTLHSLSRFFRFVNPLFNNFFFPPSSPFAAYNV